jgi:hypothetical protein
MIRGCFLSAILLGLSVSVFASEKTASCKALLTHSEVVEIKKLPLQKRLEYFRALKEDGAVIDVRLKGNSWETVRVLDISKNDFGQRQWTIHVGNGSFNIADILTVQRVFPGSRQATSHVVLVPIDLSREMTLSGVDEDTWASFKGQKAKLITVYEYLASTKQYKGRPSLGIGRSRYHELSQLGSLVDYREIYSKYEIKDGPYHTEEFMDHLFRDEKAPIVFFIPRSLFGFKPPKGNDEHLPEFLRGDPFGVTMDEFNWIEEHPEYLKNVVFVFGAYNFMPRDSMNEMASKGYESLLRLKRLARRFVKKSYPVR